ncbi:MAG: neutral/alkaline non-lysosomal ceramidase N-terminal domain-containing protein [Bryobacteraceae bacterium]
MTVNIALFVFLISLGTAFADTAFADTVEQRVKDAKPSGLLAGVARADITPPSGIAHLNWGSQTHVVATGIDPAGMVATAIVFSDGARKFAMVDMDYHNVRGLDDAIARASKLTGIPAAHIRIGVTHTHSGPNFQAEKGPVGTDPATYERVLSAYKSVVSDKVVGIIAEANAGLRPVHAYAARGIGSINANRRVRAKGDMPPAVGVNLEGFVDRELVVMRIDNAVGKPFAFLVNFPCHGTVLTFENKMISPDWVGMVRKRMEQVFPGALCLFFQGAAGNQGPIEGGTGDLSVAHSLGSALGLEAAAVAFKIDTVRRERVFEGFTESTAFAARQPWRVLGPRSGVLKFASKTLDLPRRTYTAKEMDRMSSLAAEARRKVDDAAKSGDAWQKAQAEARHRRYADLLTRWKQQADPSPVQVEVQILRIGDMAVVAMPGEPFAEIGVAIKKASPFDVTMFCGYSTGKGGDYMPVESEYALGGYEVERTPYGVHAAEKLIRETIELYKQVQ